MIGNETYEQLHKSCQVAINGCTCACHYDVRAAACVGNACCPRTPRPRPVAWLLAYSDGAEECYMGRIPPAVRDECERCQPLYLGRPA